MPYTHEQVMAMDADALRLAIAEAQKMFIPSLTTDEWSIAVDHGMVPDWPNDLAAAWELVEEIIDSDERMSVSVQVKKGNIQFCDLTQWNPFHKPGIEGRGETKEIAICRAWLMWKAGR